MALANFSLPFGALAQPWGVTLAPLHPLHQLASNTNNLLYSPADHQQPQSAADAGPPAAGSDYYKNNPYGPPEGQGAQPQQQTQPGYPYSGRRKQGSAYLPPTGGGRNSVYHIQQQQAQQHAQHTQQAQLETNENSVSFHSSSASSSGQSQSTLQLTQSAGRGPAEGSYTRYPGQAPQPPSPSSSSSSANKQQKQYYNAHGSASSSFSKSTGSFSITSYGSRQPQGQQQPQGSQQQPQLPNLQPQQPPLQPQSTQSQRGRQQAGGKTETPASTYGVAPPDNYPERAPGFTRVQAGQGSRTQVHAVLDYDVEEGDEEEEEDDGEYYDAQGQNKGE